MSDRLREMARKWLEGELSIQMWTPAATDPLAALLARVQDEERERCAKVAEATSMEFAYAGSRADELARVIAAAIRAMSPGTADAEEHDA